MDRRFGPRAAAIGALLCIGPAAGSNPTVSIDLELCIEGGSCYPMPPRQGINLDQASNSDDSPYYNGSCESFSTGAATVELNCTSDGVPCRNVPDNELEIAVDGSACALSGSGPWECGFTMVSGTDHEIRIDIESDDYDLGYYFEVTAASSGVPSGGSNKDGC